MLEFCVFENNLSIGSAQTQDFTVRFSQRINTNGKKSCFAFHAVVQNFFISKAYSDKTGSDSDLVIYILLAKALIVLFNQSPVVVKFDR
jgi:hypothetical protein